MTIGTHEKTIAFIGLGSMGLPMAKNLLARDSGAGAGTLTIMAAALAAVAHQMFLSVSGVGDGDADDSQVLRAYRSLDDGA